MKTGQNIQDPLKNISLSADEMLLRNFFPPQIKWFSKSVNQMYRAQPTIAYKMTMAALSFSVRKPLKPKDMAFYAKGKKHIFRCKQKTFNTYSYGKGPEVYLVHGWGSYGARWKLYVDELVRKGYCAVVVDAPAHGTSPGLFLSLPDYVLALKHVFNRAKHLHGVINHSIGGLCSIVALKESTKTGPFKIALLSSFNSAESLLFKFGGSIGIKEEILTGIVPWIPRYAGYGIAHLSVSRHLDARKDDVFMVYDRDDIIVPAIEPMTLLNEHPNIMYCPTYGLGHNLKSPKIIEETIAFISK
ncbi:MAG: hypothetical protein CMH48_05545 [Muricauda sp.]|nr:alpha/beta fold hydrolase [Allomuricauda sp.]MAU26635.1 hypothetical protein [Allomuricauda sp.]MBC30290.1 hypothetical protein [Allomuricauda sp.]